ncbi:MAG: hypothetical protein C5B45_06650 [Chlamydiae bacterium]|nr:MAG: hypothetical protein C5B45_06650 [Chlamydiota bacterium]
MSFSLESCLLHFWSPLPGSITEEVCQSPKTTQKTDTVFTVATLQSGFIEDLKELEDTGFFNDLAFLDDFKNEDLTQEESSDIGNSDSNTTKRSSEIPCNQTIANPYKNGQNSNNSTKEASPRRSKRIAEKRDFTLIESSSRSIGASSPKKYPMEFKKKL